MPKALVAAANRLLLKQTEKKAKAKLALALLPLV